MSRHDGRRHHDSGHHGRGMPRADLLKVRQPAERVWRGWTSATIRTTGSTT
jgi:hypothetical protein